jgi:hypothetical protein
MEPKSPHLRLPLDADPSVFIWAYTNTGEIRIRFDEGGFVKWRLFRHVFKNGRRRCEDDPSVVEVRASNGVLVQRFPRGPVTIETKADLLKDEMEMRIVVELPERKGKVEKVLDHATCVEIAKRLRQVESLIETYEEDEEEDDAAA